MKSGNGKILFVASTLLQHRNYFKTPALKEIKDRLVILANPGLNKMDFGVPNDHVFFYRYPNLREKWHRHVFNINRWRNRKKSTSITAYLSKLDPFRLRIYKILSLPILSNIAKFLLLERSRDPKMSEIIRKIDPSLVLIPSSLYDAMAFELVRVCKEMNIPSFILVDNWDNLSSKNIFTFKPDYLAAWSRQSAEHAVSINDMPKNRIFIMGAPRFMDYLKPENNNLSSPYPFKYILFAGSSFQYNELAALKKVDDLVEKNNLDIKIVFRPAQAQREKNCPDVFFEYNFKHIILDTPAQLFYKRWPDDGFNPIYAPELCYYPKLLSNMEFMICLPSTMLLEGLFFDKKAFVLAYDDGVSPYGPKHHFDLYFHFKGIDRLKNVRIVHNFDDIEKIFAPGDILKQQVKPIDIDYFISREATINYPANLKKVVDGILATWSYK